MLKMLQDGQSLEFHAKCYVMFPAPRVERCVVDLEEITLREWEHRVCVCSVAVRHSISHSISHTLCSHWDPLFIC